MTVRLARKRDLAQQCAGFTLVEMLVSLAILALVATMLLEGVVGSAHIARRASNNQQAGAEVAAAQFILRARITTLRPVVQIVGGEPTMDVRGTDRVLDFFGRPSAGSAQGGIVKYRLMLTSVGDVVLFQAPELTDHFDLRSPGVVGWRASPILRGASTMAIAYFGATRDDPERKWRSFWRYNATAPELVRIRIGFREGDGRLWPDFIIHPVTTVRLDCDPEARTKSCGGEG